MNNYILVDVLMEYVIEGNYEKFYDALEGISDVNKICHNGFSMLHHAATHGHVEMVEHLISKGHNVNWRDDETGSTPMHNAIKNRHSKIVKILMLNGAEIDTKDFHGKEPLHYAAENGDVELVDLILSKGHSKIIAMLLKVGADVKAQDNLGKTALHYAAQKGHLKCVELLLSNKYNNLGGVMLSKGVEVDVLDKNGATPFFYSVIGGFFDVAKLLVSNGADINVKTKNGDTPIMAAARNGNKSVCDFLISLGADVFSKNKFGNDAFLISAKNGNIDLLKILIDMGIDVNIVNKEGKNALLLAIEKNHTKTTEFLVNSKIDLNHTDNKGYFPLLMCVIHGNVKVFRLLLEKGAALDISAENNEEILYAAARYGNFRIFKMVMKRYNKFDKDSIISKNALITAAKNGHLNIVKTLVKSGVPVDVRDKYSNTLLHIACLNGYEPIVNYLVECQLDVNSVNDAKETPLHKAAEYGRSTKIVLTLLDLGADLEAEDVNKKNPLNIASKKTQFNVFEILLKNNPENITLRKAMLKATNKLPPNLAKILKNTRKLINKYRSMSTENINEENFEEKNGLSVNDVLKDKSNDQYVFEIPDEIRNIMQNPSDISDYRMQLMMHYIVLKKMGKTVEEELATYLKKNNISLRKIDDVSLLNAIFRNIDTVYVATMTLDLSVDDDYVYKYNPDNYVNTIQKFDEFIAPFIEMLLINNQSISRSDIQTLNYEPIINKRLLKLKSLMEMPKEEREIKAEVYKKKADKLSKAPIYKQVNKIKDVLYRYKYLDNFNSLIIENQSLDEEKIKSEMDFLKNKYSRFNITDYNTILEPYEDVEDKINFCKTCVNFSAFLTDTIDT